MQKVIIVCSGAGKSTFARGLRDKTGLPLYYLDNIWWNPDGTHIPREEFDARLAEILATERWIIDGYYSRTLETRIKACDTVFYLDIPLADCLAGAASRVGTAREDLPWVETEFVKEFRQWIEDFPQREAALIEELLEKYRGGRDIVVFKSRVEMDAYFM